MIVRNDNDWLTATMGGHVVLLNIQNKEVIGLSEVGAQIWDLIATPKTSNAICAALSQQYQATPDDVRPDVERLLRDLQEAGATIDPSQPMQAPQAMSPAATASENLQRAIQSGAVQENPDGSLQLASPRGRGKAWMYVDNGPALGCGFLMDFMFNHVYARSAVPHGCSACYKVKAVPRTLRELVAAWNFAQRVQCRSKWGIDLDNPYSQNVYAGYFYVSGLDTARALLPAVRAAFDADPRIGPEVALTIKRGCSEYEALLGPSDRYAFNPETAELERSLKARFRQPRRDDRQQDVLAHWIDVAFRQGDDTYLDFTGGRRRRAKTVAYPP